MLTTKPRILIPETRETYFLATFEIYQEDFIGDRSQFWRHEKNVVIVAESKEDAEFDLKTSSEIPSDWELCNLEQLQPQRFNSPTDEF